MKTDHFRSFWPLRVADVSPTTFIATQLSQIHHVLWCKPIDLCFFRDLILDCLQAAQFPSSPHLSSVSHKSMWCNCINSLSHSSALETEYSQSESVSVWCPWLVKVLFWPFKYLCLQWVSFIGNVWCFRAALFFQAAGLWKLSFSQLVLTVYIWLIHSKLSRLNLISLSAFCVEPSMISPDVSPLVAPSAYQRNVS